MASETRRRHSRRGGPNAPHMLIRRQLFDMARDIVFRDGLGDQALAHIIHTSRPRASALIHGYIDEFNSETLVDILARLGVTVEINVTRTQRYARWHFERPRPGWKPLPNVARG